jgi:hypothetical protein
MLAHSPIKLRLINQQVDHFKNAIKLLTNLKIFYHEKIL